VYPVRTLLAILLAGTLCACGPATSSELPNLRVLVLATLPHDTSAFTEGLELAGDQLYESTGLRGRSSVRVGTPGQPPQVTVSLPASLFGEGITVLGPTLWQLTWQDGVAIERDSRTLAELRRVSYRGEGWGLCHRRGRLVMSDGSDQLTFRDPVTFAPLGTVTVHGGGQTYSELNELECVGNTVYANVWQTDEILRIEAGSGTVTGLIDASGLLTPQQRRGADVLNGIAAIPGTDEFFVTGKLWPAMFRVEFVPVA
jgi:glutaminyl-peptide cyclotransferase